MVKEKKMKNVTNGEKKPVQKLMIYFIALKKMAHSSKISCFIDDLLPLSVSRLPFVCRGYHCAALLFVFPQE